MLDHRMKFIPFLLLLIAVPGCSDSTGPASRPTSELQFLRPAADAPPLVATRDSFYAKRGSDREIRMYFRPKPGEVDSSEFLRLRVQPNGLSRRPDGSAFATGDSVLITVTVIDPARFIVEFQPSGLRFSASAPAELEMEYKHADDDLNEDGRVDSRDDDVEIRLRWWRRETPAANWFQVASVVFKDLEEVEADLLGFTSYAVAY